ncbi:LysR family transcriptional regulator [Rhodanobacter glycinis]|uniref:LysR family transcriptional regulator n=1 Tax=Rhodanobacter glycinis TaxID=582702 RepID=A0A5B9E2C3_9GAMM|nr:LysR family transcriptional regulator [Rhodanobacter glycinis]QEE24416.1 LysR family transcriptional regulator [Rhodanobacter glycinis]
MSQKSPWFLRARLKTRQLLLLVAIADEGNTHRAAETLNVSQPAASKLLKDLEDMMGVPLFDRLPRGMRATLYGEVMIRHARIALASLGEAGAEIDSLKEGYAGNVRVGAIQGPAVTLIPEAIQRAIEERPLLRVSLLVESSDVLMERLTQSKLDILVARLFAQHDKSQLHYQALAEEKICAIVRPAHPLLSIRRPSLADMAQCGWIVPPAGSVLRHRFELMFRNEGLELPARLIESTALVFVLNMLRRTDYISVIPADAASYYVDHGIVSVVPTELACKMDDFGIITRKDWLLSPAAQCMLAALKQAASDVYGLPRMH